MTTLLLDVHKFSTVEEERDYLKAQVEYLKKRNPNLHLAIWKVNRFLIINELRKKYPLTWLVEIGRVITTNGLVQIQTGAESNSDPPSSSILRISKNVIALRKKGWNVNHKRVYRLMKELNLRSLKAGTLAKETDAFASQNRDIVLF
ncbi:IS3 family transposase [Brevibacillus halotolerans]|uniref:IS3 family transposase n=1 Tax=Brevibacillus halotolerans TaxID=1507437 RepID=UPI003D1793F9